MIDEKTPNKKYPLPNPENIAKQDVERVATSISMIDSDISECDSVIDGLEETVDNLSQNSIKIPDELIGHFDTELKDISAQKYLVINSEGTGFATVEGGGGEGGKKGEILIKRSDANFDTTWADPRALQKQSPTVNETSADFQLKCNNVVVLADNVEIDNSDQLPRVGLTPRQVTTGDTIDENYSYILCDELEEMDNSDSNIASKTNYGRVKIGEGINVDENGVISVESVGIASKTKAGIVKIGDGINIENGVISAQEYKQATNEEFGTVKLSDDFAIGSEGELILAGKQEADYIIYQSAKIEAVYDSNIVINPECALYRAFIDTDTAFKFDFSQFTQEKDLAFDVEIYSEGDHIISFENVIWNLPCAGVSSGKTVIHFEKKTGLPYLEGSLKETSSQLIRNLTPHTTDDIVEDYACGHNGIGWDAKWCITVKDYSNYASFTNPKGGIWYIDFMRSTYVEYLEYLNGFDNWTADYFYIEGSVDGKNWKRLYTRGSGKLPHGNYYLEHHGFFRHYRICCSHTQIRYFRWFGYDVDDNFFTLKKVVPRMTSDSSDGYNLTCSGKNDGQIYHLTASDGNWVNLKDRLDGKFWIKYELPEPAVVNMIDLGAANGSEADRFPIWFKIEASNDDENWVTLLERAELTRWYQLETRQYYIDNETPYKFYKFTPVELNGTEFRIARFRLYHKSNGLEKLENFIPTMSSASQGGYEITSSTELSGHLAYYAFDGNDSTQWATASGYAQNCWIKVRFPTETICDSVFLKARSDGWYPQAPTSFSIQASNDGITYTTLKTVNTNWVQGEEKIISFYNVKPYLYYRIYIYTVQNNAEYAALSTINFGTTTRQYKRDLNAFRIITPIMRANEQDGFKITVRS